MLLPITQEKFVRLDLEDWWKIRDYKWHLNKGSSKKYRSTDYVRGKINGKRVYLHRFIMDVSNKNIEIDHMNGDGLDCRKENLRVATHGQNQGNKGPNKNNKLGVRGVIFTDNRYVAKICINGKTNTLGYFKTVQEAKNCYDKAAKIYFGEFYNKTIGGTK